MTICVSVVKPGSCVRIIVSGALCFVALSTCVHSFRVPLSVQQHRVPLRVADALSISRLHATTEQEEAVVAIPKPSVAASSSKRTPRASLGLLTFDLDDTIYPLAPVIQEANAAFARAMERYGFPNIQPNDITLRSVQIRTEMAATDPERAATLTQTQRMCGGLGHQCRIARAGGRRQCAPVRTFDASFSLFS
jgi:hypothetical protein